MRCALFALFTFGSLCLSAISPVHGVVMQHRVPDSPPPVFLSSRPSIDTTMLITTLCEYYENILDQVMVTLTEDILTEAPHKYLALYHADSVVNQIWYRAPLVSFVHNLHDHLNLLKTNLLASIRPLVESNLSRTFPIAQTASYARSKTLSAPAIISELSRDLITLNHCISLQLGFIINAEEAAHVIISQSMPDRLITSHSNADEFDKTVKISWRDGRAFVALKRTRDENDDLDWLDTLRQVTDPKDQPLDKESKVMSKWLFSFLSDIDKTLSLEFDGRVQDVTLSILEDLLVD